MHRSVIFLCLLLAFIGGVAVGSFWAIPQRTVVIAVLICALAIAIFFRRGSRLLDPRLTFGAFLVLFMLFGILRFNLSHNAKHVLEEFAAASAQLQTRNEHKIKVDLYGYIDAEPDARSDKTQLTIHVEQLVSEGHILPTDERVLVTTAPTTQYQYGRTLHLYGELLLPKNYSPPAGGSDFDYINYLAKDGIYTVLFYPKLQPTELALAWPTRLKLALYRPIFGLKQRFVTAINQSIPEPYAAYINGVLLGARTQIPSNIKNAFARTSTSHILAISGYNIALIAWVISGFFLNFFKRPVAFWLSLAGIALFTILTGAGGSVVRAAVMGSVALLAARQGRLYDVTNGIVLTGALMILLNPEILRYDVGFQLSFAGTLGLVYVSPWLERYFTRVPEWFGLRDTLLATTAAQIFVLPLLLYYFKSLSLMSLPANLLVLPLIPYTMAVGFVMGIGGMILPILGRLVGFIVEPLAALELGIVRLFARPGWAAVTVAFPWYYLVVSYGLLIGLLWFASRKEKDYRG